MTSFPDHPAEHLRCVYCTEFVPVSEAARFVCSYPMYSLHVDCEEEWEGLDLLEKRAHRLLLDEIRLCIFEQFDEIGKEDDEYWRELCKEQGNPFVTSTWWRA